MEGSEEGPDVHLLGAVQLDMHFVIVRIGSLFAYNDVESS